MPKQRRNSLSKTPQRVKKRKATRSSFKFSLPKTLFFVGSIFVCISLLYHVHQLAQLSFYQQHIPNTVHLTSRPVEISIPKVDLDLPVLETIIANSTWQIADNGISHLAITSRPGEDGTIILYGHNTEDRFGPLLWLSVGDSIVLTNGDNKTFTYVIKKIVTVDPSDTKVLTTQKGPTLILYTCTGFADLKRYVLIAKPTK